MSSSHPSLEIAQHTAHLLDGEEGWELPIRRSENLRLTEDSRQQLVERLTQWAREHHWPAGRSIWCPVSGRGVSLRKLTFPGTARQNLDSVLALQIESQFPVSPSELAWGYVLVSSPSTASEAEKNEQTALVGAVKPDLLEDSRSICEAAGMPPRFVLAGLARSALCADRSGAFSILSLEPSGCELISLSNGTPEGIRTLRWGSAVVVERLAAQLGLTTEEALTVYRSPLIDRPKQEVLRQILQTLVTQLAQQIQASWVGERLYLCGSLPGTQEFDEQLAKALRPGLRTERLPVNIGPGFTAANQGARDWQLRFPRSEPLCLQKREDQPAPAPRESASFRWGLLAAVLLICLLSLRYVEPLLGKPRLARKIEEVEAQKALLPKLDQELTFLQYLQRNQPPMLEAITTIAESTAPGLRLDSLTLNRRGEVSLRGMLPTGEEATGLRLKMVESGFFSSVVLEEQSPTPDRDRVIIRISAQWKSPEERVAAAVSRSSKVPPRASAPPAAAPPSTNTTAPQPQR